MNALDTLRRPFGSLVQISIIKDDIRRLSSQLERNNLQVRFRGGFLYFAACERTTSECNFSDMRVVGQGMAGSCTQSIDDIDNTRREDFLDQRS
jgi:hypothetical protein